MRELRALNPKMGLSQSELSKAARSTLRIAQALGWTKKGERWMHGVLLGILEEKVGHMQSEFQVPRGRIDLRHGGTNPSVVELVVRKHGVEEAPSANSSELQKLCRVANEQARTRYLLILDISGYSALRKQTMQNAYTKHNAGPGRFDRASVRVMYVHPDPKHDFDFIWRP